MLMKKERKFHMRDEKLAIQEYEKRLMEEKYESSNGVYTGNIEQNNRIALAVIKQAIENILGWTPEQANEKFTMEIIKKLKLTDEWNNLDLPEEIKRSGDTKYILKILYPAVKKDERLAILMYGHKLLNEKENIPINIYDSDVKTRNRLALSVIKHVIENNLGWSPAEAYKKLTLDVIKDLKLIDEWNNLDIPEEDKKTGSVTSLFKMLYPFYIFD